MEGKTKGSHEWIIEFKVPPKVPEIFNKALDKALQEINSDYEAKRFNNLTLNPPTIHYGRQHLFLHLAKNQKQTGRPA